MSEKDLMIYLAHGNAARRKIVSATLELLNHRVALSTGQPAILLRRCQENPPDVAIVGTEFDQHDIFDVLNGLSRIRKCPVIAILQSGDVDRSRRLLHDRVMGILVEPVDEGDLRTSIYLARRRFTQARRMEDRIHDLRKRLGEQFSESPE